MKKLLIEGTDYYYNDEGYMVLTESYHLERGICCGNGCTHCPYNYSNVPLPQKTELIIKRSHEQNNKSKS